MTVYTRTEHLRHELAEQIRNGTLKPGERIMSETRLAEEYQVSRGTVRRALEQLKKAELIARPAWDREAMWRSTAAI